MWHLFLTAFAGVSLFVANLLASVAGHASAFSTGALVASLAAGVILAVLPIRCRARTDHAGGYNDR